MMLNEREKNLAIRESECLAAMEAFFPPRQWFARTSGTHNCTERLFEAAFERGWDARQKQLDISE